VGRRPAALPPRRRAGLAGASPRAGRPTRRVGHRGTVGAQNGAPRPGIVGTRERHICWSDTVFTHTRRSPKCRYGYDELLADKFARGSGSGEPQGILTALSANTNVRVKVTTSGILGLVDLHRVWSALPERFRSRAAWVSSASVMNTVRALGTAVSASFSVTLTQAGPETLMGRPYRNSAYFEDSTSGTGNMNWLVVGDFSSYLVARRSGLRLEPVQLLFGLTSNRPTGQRGTFGWARVGAASANDLGFRILTNVT